MILQMLNYAGSFERFAPEAASNLVGMEFEAKVEDRVIGRAKVIGGHVIDSGRAIAMSVDWPESEDYYFCGSNYCDNPLCICNMRDHPDYFPHPEIL